MSLISVGTMAFDAIETPFGKTEKIVGGSATYVAYAAANFVKPIQQISIIGYDFPKEEMNELRKRGVQLEGVEIIPDKKSFFWSGRYHEDMNSRDTLITMNFWMESAMDDLKKVLKQVDLLMVNDAEARQLTGQFSLVKAARAILQMGPKFLIIKKGEHGALLFHNQEVFFAPALPLEDVFDPTGAGDTFAGGFMGHLAKSGDISFDNMKRAIIVGSAMASY